jgi:acyl-CoA synthetase (NDP forming)/GNAT superfamily N-acetyltransferase
VTTTSVPDISDAAERVDALAADGAIIAIRPVVAADAPALQALYQRGTLASLRSRFFSVPGHDTVPREVARLTRPASRDHAVLVAEERADLVGVASYERDTHDDLRAEFAVFVADAEHGRGIGTLLLEHLAERARRSGIVELTGDVLAGNAAMLRVATDIAGRFTRRHVDGVVDVALATVADEDALAALDHRDRMAEHASLRPLLCPRSVAVIGASRHGGIGHETLRAIVEYGFTGSLYAVNPHADQIAGVPAYPSLRDVPGAIDLAVIAVPAVAVAAALTEAAAAGARAAVIVSSGFGEGGEAGRAAQADLVRIARAHSIRIVGPNCIGVLNTDAAVRLDATFAPTRPTPGGLAVASQSGAVGVAVLDHAARTGCGISTFVSLGNKADVSGNDLIAYWYDDPATRAVALYLESFGNPRRFARVVRALARRKPVLAVKSGRSDGGRRAGASHTAAAAAPDVAVDTLFAQAGVVRVDTLGELLDAARMLTDQPLPTGHRLAIIGNAGGVNVLAADAAEAVGLTVPDLADIGNPLDLGAGATPSAFADALARVAAAGPADAGGQVDAVLLVVAGTRANDVPAMLSAVTAVLDRHPRLPAAAVLLGVTDAPAALGERRVPVFDLPERAVRAIGQAARYAAWRREPLGTHPVLSDVDSGRARTAIGVALRDGHEGWQPYPVIAEILGGYGITMVPTAEATSADEAVAAAEQLGYPAVIKAADPALVHKSDVGGVRLRLGDAEAVRSAYHEVTNVVGSATVLVQRMAAPGVELVTGVVHDPLFGSLVMLGLGGVHTDLLGDRAFRLVPMTDLDAGRMWRSLRGARLLTGYRGSPAVDTAALEELLLRVGLMAEAHPEIVELDLNPVIAGPDGVVAVDAKLRLAAAGVEPDAVTRRLRSAA